MDDGSFARPLFSECLFEYGRRLVGLDSSAPVLREMSRVFPLNGCLHSRDPKPRHEVFRTIERGMARGTIPEISQLAETAQTVQNVSLDHFGGALAAVKLQ